MPLLDTLLRRKEARIQLARRNRSLASADVLAEIVVVLVEPVQDVRGEVLGAQWLANGSKGVGEARDLVEVLGDDAIEQLNLAKLSADGVSPRLRLPHASRDVVAKMTRDDTLSVSEDWMAERMA